MRKNILFVRFLYDKSEHFYGLFPGWLVEASIYITNDFTAGVVNIEVSGTTGKIKLRHIQKRHVCPNRLSHFLISDVEWCCLPPAYCHRRNYLFFLTSVSFRGRFHAVYCGKMVHVCGFLPFVENSIALKAHSLASNKDHDQNLVSCD